MKKIILSLIFLITLNAYAQTADELLDKTIANTKSYPSLSVTFDCIITDSDNVSQIFSGEAFMKGNSYKMNAFDQTIICNGTTKWTYVPDDEEVVVDNVGKEGALTPLSFLDMIPENGKATFVRKSEGTRTIRVKGEFNGKQREVEMTIDEAKLQPKDVTLIENDGTKRIVIKTIDTTELPDSTFTFDSEQHPDVEVIDMR